MQPYYKLCTVSTSSHWNDLILRFNLSFSSCLPRTMPPWTSTWTLVINMANQPDVMTVSTYLSKDLLCVNFDLSAFLEDIHLYFWPFCHPGSCTVNATNLSTGECKASICPSGCAPCDEFDECHRYFFGLFWTNYFCHRYIWAFLAAHDSSIARNCQWKSQWAALWFEFSLVIEL